MAPLLCAPTRRVRPSCKGFRCLLLEKRVVIGEMLLTDMPLEILSLQEREGIGQEHASHWGPDQLAFPANSQYSCEAVCYHRPCESSLTNNLQGWPDQVKDGGHPSEKWAGR